MTQATVPSTSATRPAVSAVAEPAALHAGGDTHQYLTFALNGEMFALAILNIKEIIEYGSLTEVPMMPGFIRGVINLRGAVVPVIDLSVRFNRPPTEISRRTRISVSWSTASRKCWRSRRPTSNRRRPLAQ